MNFASNQNLFLLASNKVPKKEKKVPMKIKFTPEEDAKLISFVKEIGTKNWIRISQLMGTRNPRQCRERWCNYINPELRKDPWTEEEDKILEEKYAEFGPKWNKLAKFFNNRGDNNIRNRWMMISRHKAKNMYNNHKENIKPELTSIIKPNPVKMQQIEHNVLVQPVIVPVMEKERVSNMNFFDDDSFIFSNNCDFDVFNEDRGSELWENTSFF